MGKEYELVGGQPVKITPLEVEDAGTYYAPHGQAFNPVIAKSGGGGGGGLLVLDDSNLSPAQIEGFSADAIYVYDGSMWMDITAGGGDAVYVYNGNEADLTSKVICVEREMGGYTVRAFAQQMIYGPIESHAAPHKQGADDTSLFITNANTLYNIAGFGAILPSTAIIETGYMEHGGS